MSYAHSSSSNELNVLAEDRYSRYSNHPSFVLYTLLPALHRRFLKLRSLREVIPYIPSRIRHSRVSSCVSEEVEASITPPPSYTAHGPGGGLPEARPAIVRWMEGTAMPGTPPSGPSFSGSTTPTYVGDSVQESVPGPVQGPVEEPESGVRWRYANPGYASLMLAQSEHGRPAANSSFVRRQYISGVSCLLLGLPTELTAEEKQSLDEALPAELKRARFVDRQIAPRPDSSSEEIQVRPVHRQSTLQHCVAVCTLYMFLAAAFIIPYLQYMLREAYQFDRRHKISDKLLSHGIDTAAAVRRSTFTIAAQVCSMNDGKVGEQLKDVSMYMVQGLGSGVYDGIGEGMQVLGLRTSRER